MVRAMNRLGSASALAVLVLCFAVAEASEFQLFCGKQNCFEVLGLNRSSTSSEIRRAYRQLALDLHPDKNPSKEAEERFRLVTTAYEVVGDKEKREEYEDFLDNPRKYYWYYAQYMTKEYAKADVKVVLFVLLFLFSGLHWANMWLNYQSMQRRIKDSPHYKKQVAGLVASGEAKNPKEAESMINVEIVGCEKPHWRRSLPVVLVKLPVKTARLMAWAAHWAIAYWCLKRDYTLEDKEFLVRQTLEISPAKWEEIEEEERKDLVKREVWVKENLEIYWQDKRIEMNKAGKRRTRRRQRVSVPLDEMVEY